jgi:hypothetical protein
MKSSIVFTGIILLMYACNVKSDIPQEQTQQPISVTDAEVNWVDTSNNLNDNLKDQIKTTTPDDITFNFMGGVEGNFEPYLDFTFTNNTNKLVTAVKLRFVYKQSYEYVNILIKIPPHSTRKKKYRDISSESTERITLLEYISNNKVYPNGINAFFEKTEDELKNNPAYNY